MAYTPTNWTNFPSTATPVNANNLNKIENELVALDTGKADESAVTTALAGKVDKVAGKGLSTNDYDNTAKGIVDGVTTALEDKVDKVEGYGLSENDYTTAEKTKLAGISAEANKVEITPVVTEGTTLATISIDGVDTDIKGSDIEVDDEMSPTSENPVQNKVIYDTLQNILPEETAEGNPISITDASGLSAKSCEVAMNPIQDLHGQSAPYPAGGGKNKLEINITTTTNNGVTFTVNTDSDGNVISIVCNGTPISGNANLQIGINKVRGYDSILNGAPSGGSLSTFLLYISGTTIYDFGDGVNIPSSETNANITISIRSGYTANNLVFKPMIRLTTETDATFVPYSNICPISGRDSVVLHHPQNKNLFGDYTSQSGMDINSSGEIVSGANYNVYKLRVTNKQYVLSFLESATSSGYHARILARDKNDTDYSPVFVRQVTYNATTDKLTLSVDLSTLTDVGYIYVALRKSTSNIQLEYETTATDYIAYSSVTHTATFPTTVYGGKLDFVSGKGLREYSLIAYNGTENWSLSDTPHVFYISISSIFQNESILICNKYKGLGNGSSGSMNNNEIRRNRNANNLLVRDDRADTVEEFKALCVAENINVVYYRNTPVEITLTTETIELLKGNNTLWTDGDSVKLVYSADIKSYIAEQLSSLS